MNWDIHAIEEYWKKKWEEDGLYRTDVTSDKKKLYLLVEFPYPSGEGLHVGHVRSYTAMDAIARKKRREGYEVLFPMGYDAFGLPAENYAIKTGIHPRVTTEKNIANFRNQMKKIGFSFDWEKEVNTTDPAFYKWTQWIFLKMYEKGLAYKREMPVNWCPKDKCVLANEEVIDGACERCGTPVEKKNKKQWMLAITKYAERLDKDLDETTYLDKIKIQQRNWIGLSEGSEIDFYLDFKKDPSVNANRDSNGKAAHITVFTTRADTLAGATYLVLAPEHPWVKLATDGNHDVLENKEEVKAYAESVSLKQDIERTALGKEKTGIELKGVKAINPLTKEEIPMYVADYVLPQYGTGAIMAVPAHDERDAEFAKTYGIPVKEVVRPYVIDHVNVPRSDKPTKVRNNVHAIVRDPKTNKFLIIRNSIHKWDTVVIGGIENGEDLVEAARRELREETGYVDVEYKRTLGDPVQAGYFAPHKDENRLAIASAVYFELVSDKREHIEEGGENEGNEVLWVDESDFVPGKMINSELPYWLARLKDENTLFTDDGILVHSGSYDGLSSAEARRKITEDLGGKIVKKSKLRDWVFARQRYWGEPTPIVYDEHGNMYPVHESNLPIVLPNVDKFEPTDNGESPLYQVPEWVNVKGYIDEQGYFHEDESSAASFKRETDTMPQWAGSSWYFMRYIDPKNDASIADPKLLTKWLPVDWYNGGMEHTTLHLLYSRFWYKFLFDIGIVPTSEPYYKRTSQGMILGTGGVKMSKSLGNVVNPDDIVKEYGADVLRVYEMFIGPFDQPVAWDDKAIIGIERFLDKVIKIRGMVTDNVQSLPVVHQTIQKVTEGIDGMLFNTSIAQLMICANELEKAKTVAQADYEALLSLLAPFAPFTTEELWKDLGHTDSIHRAAWPVEDASLLVEKEATIAIQVNGKLRGTITLPRDTAEMGVVDEVKKTDMYAKYVGSETPKKVIFVPNKLINIVI